MLLQYKLRESEDEWRPRKIFDVASKRWICADGTESAPEYSAISGMTENHMRMGPELLKFSVPSDSPDWQKMKRSIMDKDAHKYRLNWNADSTASWNDYFQSTNPTVMLSPWVISDSSPVSDSEIVEFVPFPTADHVEHCPEPFVAADKATADAWKASKRRKTIPTPEASQPAPVANQIVAVGDVIIMEPDDASRAKDIEFGYTLPISFGKVAEVDTVEECVQVHWLFCTSLEGKFSNWPQAELCLDKVSFSHLVRRENSSEVLKVEFTRQRN